MMPRSLLTALLAAMALPISTAAQTQGSEKQTVVQTISGTDLQLTYWRPSARNRSPLFGGVVHWDEIWTPGANYVTRLSSTKDFELGGAELEAGAYGMWIQVLEDQPWKLLLHPDTVRGHGFRPDMSEFFLEVRLEPETTADFTETLHFDFQNIRADAAELVLRWGTTALTVPLGIDPGFVSTIAADEADRYVGRWTLDESPSLPTDEQVEGWMSNPDMSDENKASFRRYLDFTAEPRTVELLYQPEHSRLVMLDESQQRFFEMIEEDEEAVPNMTLLPRAEGIFGQANMMGGEIAFASDFAFIEFEFDDQGRAVAFAIRASRDDSLQARGTRIGN